MQCKALVAQYSGYGGDEVWGTGSALSWLWGEDMQCKALVMHYSDYEGNGCNVRCW